MYVMLLVGLVGGGIVFGTVLAEYSHTRLIQVVQGAGLVSVALNLFATWRQEARNPQRRHQLRVSPPEPFREQWSRFVRQPRARRFLWAVFLGTAAFNMQEIVLEPYGGEVLQLTVGQTSSLTALLAGGSLAAFALAARLLARGADPLRVAALGAVVGLPAFAAVLLAAPFESALMFRIGTVLIGFGAGLFSVSTLTAAISLESRRPQGLDVGLDVGLALGAWGAVQATAAGLSVALGGALRDAVSELALQGRLGDVLQGTVTGYGAVYHLELVLLFLALVAVGPLVRRSSAPTAAHGFTAPDREHASLPKSGGKFGLADLPG